MNQWISLHEQLPPHEEVLITDGRLVALDIYEDGRWENDGFARASCPSDVTHWMPLPALPGEAPHTLFGAREIVLPEGESPTAITTYKDHVIVACASGKIFSVWGASGLRDAFIVKECVFAVSQDEEPS